MNVNLRCALLASFIAASGCLAGGEDVEPGQVTEQLVNPNGVSLNGVRLNGVRLNGVRLNGVRLNGVTMGGVTVTGVTVKSTKLDGTKAGKNVHDRDFVGAQMTGTLSDGTTLAMRIDSATQLSGSNSEVWAYGVSYQDAGVWQYLCGVDDSNAEQLAIAVPGSFNYGTGVTGGGSYTADPTVFTFGCRATAIAKCIEMGYKYWKPVPGNGTQTLLNHMVACTRLLRADYCGDGNSWTVDGTPVNIYDGRGIQGDAAGWPIEAEWAPGGANCMSPTNYERWRNVSATAPTCFAAKKNALCGLVTDFVTTSTLIMDEYQH